MIYNEKHINTESLCSLCRLSLTDEEMSALEKDLESIIAFAKAVEGADTATASDSIERKNVFRTDIPADKKSMDYTNIAKDCCEEYFCVPKAVE